MGYFDAKKKRIAAAEAKATPTTKGQTKRQTTKINGQRAVITKRMNAAGEIVVKTQVAAPLEWMLQAAQVLAMRKHEAYGKLFTFAGDMNAGNRGPKAQAEAVATGMVSGEPDLRLSFVDGSTVYVENKAGKGRLSQEQKDRHKELRRMRMAVHVINGDSEADSVAQIIAIIDAKLRHIEEWTPEYLNADFMTMAAQ